MSLLSEISAYSGFAGSDAEADARFRRVKTVDPFPGIPASLLNSADIYDYVRVTGMLHPFREEELKSGSYEAAIAGRCICWDGNGNKQEINLGSDRDSFFLEANSIAFVQVEPHFRLPDYIALRFNLKITHVHRGVLLGTGPLVDPGFEGRLLIPLHNLTTNRYQLRAGEGLIWVEFTKTSPLPGQEAIEVPPLPRLGTYKSFPEKKKEMQPEEYLSKASPHTAIRSSIPEAARESREAAARSALDARNAVERTERIESRIRTWGLWGAVGGLIAVAALTVSTWTLMHDSWKVKAEVREQLGQLLQRQQEDKGRLQELQEQVRLLELRLTAPVPESPASSKGELQRR